MRSLCKVTNRQLSCVDECGQAAVTWTCETALTAAAVKTSEHRHSTMSTVHVVDQPPVFLCDLLTLLSF